MTNQPTSERAPAEDEKLAKMVEECARCWHSYAAHDSAASDHGECTHYGCSCDAFVSPPAPEQGVEPPERIWLTVYDDGEVSPFSLREQRIFDPERDTRHFQSIEYVRARSVPAEQQELAERMAERFTAHLSNPTQKAKAIELYIDMIMEELNRAPKEKD